MKISTIFVISEIGGNECFVSVQLTLSSMLLLESDDSRSRHLRSNLNV